MIVIDEKQVEQLKDQIQDNTDEIICGAVLGYTENNITVIQSLIQLKNEKFENRKSGYLISPDQYQAAEQLAGLEGLEILGFYHSSDQTTPTEYDLRFALPGITYLITSTNNNETVNVSAWLLNDTRKGFDKQKTKLIKLEEKYLFHELAIAV